MTKAPDAAARHGEAAVSTMMLATAGARRGSRRGQSRAASGSGMAITGAVVAGVLVGVAVQNPTTTPPTARRIRVPAMTGERHGRRIAGRLLAPARLRLARLHESKTRWCCSICALGSAGRARRAHPPVGQGLADPHRRRTLDAAGFRVGYYGPGDGSAVTVTAEALDAVDCVLGSGSATVPALKAGATSAPTTLFVRPQPANGCVPDAGTDAGGEDTGSGRTRAATSRDDAGMDVADDAGTDAAMDAEADAAIDAADETETDATPDAGAPDADDDATATDATVD